MALDQLSGAITLRVQARIFRIIFKLKNEALTVCAKPIIVESLRIKRISKAERCFIIIFLTVVFIARLKISVEFVQTFQES